MFNPPQMWKRITCVMMIRAGRQNRDIMECAQCSLNTVKTIRSEIEANGGDYEEAARRKTHARRKDCVRTDDFLADLQVRMVQDPEIGIRALARDMGVAPGTVKNALNKDLGYSSYKDREEHRTRAKPSKAAAAKPKAPKPKKAAAPAKKSAAPKKAAAPKKSAAPKKAAAAKK